MAHGNPYRERAGILPRVADAVTRDGDGELQVGFWLVLLIAVWSAPDRTAIQQALDAVKPCGGVVKLGIRPFDKHEEISGWISGVKERWASPISLMLHSGRVLDEKVGVLKQADITRMIQRTVDRLVD